MDDKSEARNALPPAKPARNGSRMNVGQGLTPGRSLVSNCGQYRLAYQWDGNLVLYRTADNVPVWDWGTCGQSAGICTLLPDGRLVVLDDQGVERRTSVAAENPEGCFLIVQNDGNVVVCQEDGTLVWDVMGWHLQP